MNEEKKYTLEEAHKHFAAALNGKVWELLQKTDRTESENELMVHSAHASCYHWLKVGAGVNHQRAEWLIAHVYTELGMAYSALRHASRCFELTNEYRDSMSDFDWAYAYEGVARANALAGNHEEALKFMQRAEKAGQAISNTDDKNLFLSDFNSGNWHGLK